jgi:hypothetical protein
MPAALAAAVAARGGAPAPVARQSVPGVALAAAVAVVLTGVVLVTLRAPVVVRSGGGGLEAAGFTGPATLLMMTERFSREGSIDAALGVRVAGGGQEAVGPVYRAMDARTGLLPE